MVSADNLNFDVLGLMFAYLPPNDLVSVSLVSRSFLNAAIPRIYQTLFFRQAQAKKYPKMKTPFAAVIARPHLAVHVRSYEITALPLYKGQPHLDFLKDCINSLDLCKNLSKFYCASNILPSFLLSLTEKARLKDLRVNAALTTEQSDVLVRLTTLRSIVLDHASWCIMNLFPRWMATLASSLTHLTITMSNDMNNLVLEQTLSLLPNLLGLHVLSCVKVDHSAVLRAISSTPRLEDLSITTWESPDAASMSYADLCNLRKLIIDTRNTIVPTAVPALWSGIITRTQRSASPLASITFKLSERLLIGDSFIQELLAAHASTLTSLRFINCGLSTESLESIAKRCTKLEKLSMLIPVRDIAPFAGAISWSKTLNTLVDVADAHTIHGPRPSLTVQHVRQLMCATPTLKKIISDNRSFKVCVLCLLQLAGSSRFSASAAVSVKNAGTEHEIWNLIYFDGKNQGVAIAAFAKCV